MAEQKKKPEAAEPVKRTVYPYYSLNKAIELAEIVRDHGGVNSDVSKSLLAQHLQTEETSPTLNGVLGAAKLFILVDGRGSYRLTDTAKRYFFPTTEKDQMTALLDMVNGPPLFRSLISRYDGTRLPTQAMLINLLTKDYGISESWRVRAASLFMSALERVGLIDSAGFLRYKASLHATANGNMVRMTNSPTTAIAPPAIDQPPSAMPVESTEQTPQSGVAGWTYKGIRVEVPENLSMELWKKLSNYVNVLKPDEDAGC